MHYPSRLALTVLALTALAAPASASQRRVPCIPGQEKPRCHVWTGKVKPVDDGDTINVKIRGDRIRERVKVRLTGIQAMELSSYSRKRGRAGECHSVEATKRLQSLIRGGRRRVRLTSLHEDSWTGKRRRLRRHVSIRHGGRWLDLGGVLLREGHALWFPNRREWGANRRYSRLAAEAAAAGIGIWDHDACGAGPAPLSPLSLKVKWDGAGTERPDMTREWVRVTNGDPVNAVSLRGWSFRDSHLRRYTFRRGTVVPAAGSIRLRVGRGQNDANTFYWGLNETIFENVTNDRKQIGDGGYLFDPQGDLRAYVQYPCRTGCSEPLAGKVGVQANYRAPEFIRVENVSSGNVNLDQYEIESVPWFYEFRNTVLAPRQTFVLWIQRAPRVGSLVDGWGHSEYLLSDSTDVVTLRNPMGAPVTCHAWGGRKCPSY